MGETKFRVQQIDHVHVLVGDLREAAAWYEEILGLEIVPGYEENVAVGGPLTVSSDGGSTGLALFLRKPGGPAQGNTVAFRTDGEGFMTFLARLKDREVQDGRGRRVTHDAVVDHDNSYSIYFRDPDGNPYELTTYDYQHVRGRLPFGSR